MKKLKFLAFLLFAVLTCVGISSCSDDDDEPSSTEFAGSKWKVVSATDDSLLPEKPGDESIIGCVLTFQENGNVKFSPSFSWSYAKWTLNNGSLKIVVGDGEPDDYMEGQFTINGKKAIWKYHWADVNGKYSSTDYYEMILERQ